MSRLTPGVVAVLLIALVRPVAAGEPVVIDAVGDALPVRCEPAAGTCHQVPGDSQPAADIVAAHVVPDGRQLAIEVSFLDIDRPIPKIGPETGVLYTSVTFRLGGRHDDRWATVWMSVDRDFNGALTSPNAEITVGTYGGNANELSRDVPGTATVDTASNRLRIAVNMDDLHRAVSEMCAGCASLTAGSVLWSFFAQSSAYTYVGPGLLAVGVQNLARDTGWPGNRSFRL